MAKTDKALAERRVNELLSIVLDGAQGFNVFQYVRRKEQEPESAWFVAQDASPLSDAMIRKYLTRAYKAMESAHEKSRGKQRRRHIAKLNYVYAIALRTGELSVARATLKDLAEVERLLPSPADEIQKQIDELKRQIREEKENNGNAGNSQAGAGSAPS
jgi:hypothetical protein